jgi:hypothetical protein
VVFFKARPWLAHGADDAAVQVFPASHIVDHGAVGRIEEQGVDGEVTPLCVLFFTGKLHCGGASAIQVRAIDPKGGYFILPFRLDDDLHAE